MEDIAMSIWNAFAIVGVVCCLLVCVGGYVFVRRFGRKLDETKETIEKVEQDIEKKEEEASEHVYPRMLLIGVPYNSMNEFQVNHLLNSIRTGLKEELNIGLCQNEGGIVDFTWFDHSGDLNDPYPEADKMVEEKRPLIAKLMLENPNNAWIKWTRLAWYRLNL